MTHFSEENTEVLRGEMTIFKQLTGNRAGHGTQARKGWAFPLQTWLLAPVDLDSLAPPQQKDARCLDHDRQG